MVGAAAGLVKSYAPTILSVLLRTASSLDSSIGVQAECLKCIGELARVAGEELVPSVRAILDLVIEMLNDQSSPAKRDTALKTLGQIASNTGEVIKPYTDYPQLMGVLFRFLRMEANSSVRQETIKTIGMLGALDPFKHKVSDCSCILGQSLTSRRLCWVMWTTLSTKEQPRGSMTLCCSTNTTRQSMTSSSRLLSFIP